MTGRWRASHLRARLVPLLVSTLMVWSVFVALWRPLPLVWLAVCPLVGILQTRTGLWRLLAWARAPQPDELEVVRPAVGLVPAFRGRGEPRIWLTRSHHDWQVTVPRRRTLLVGAAWVAAISSGQASPEALAVQVAAAHGRAGFTTSALAAIVDVACLPGWLAGRIGGLPFRRIPSLAGYCQLVWPVMAVIGSVLHLQGGGHWWLPVGLAGLTGCVLVGPRSARLWHTRLHTLGAKAVAAAGLDAGQVWAPVVSPPLVWVVARKGAGR